MRLGRGSGRNRLEDDWAGKISEELGRKARAKKRPSVETEGRLTIACHMKRDNDLVYCIDRKSKGQFLESKEQYIIK